MRDGKNNAGADAKSAGPSKGRRLNVRAPAPMNDRGARARPAQPLAPDGPTSRGKKNDDTMKRKR